MQRRPGRGACASTLTWPAPAAPLARQTQGVFTGLSLASGRGDLVRAVLEGVAYPGAHQPRGDAPAGTTPGGGAFGGGARSAALAPASSRTCSACRLGSTDTVEDACLGAAMCAAVAAGLWPSLGNARQAMSGNTTWLTPNLSAQATYRELYARYAQEERALLASDSERPEA